MVGLTPFNRRGIGLTSTGFENFFNMLDDFFNDNRLSGRNLLKDTFKIDITETEQEYRIDAELPGVSKEEITLDLNNDTLCITVNRAEDINKDSKNYIHRERLTSSMNRKIQLANVTLDGIKAKLNGGILTITVQKNEKAITSHKIDIE